MGFLWFGKKKKSAVEVSQPSELTWSVTNFEIVEEPLAGITFSRSEIRSLLASLTSESRDESYLALGEFLQEQGCEKVELTKLNYNESQGFSAKVATSGSTLVLGPTANVLRVVAPVRSEITAAIAAGADQLFAIDALVVSAFSIAKD